MSTLPIDPVRPTAARPIPPLQSGDRLGHAEYLRRYEMMPGDIKAERIEGTVYMPPAALSAGFHGKPHADMTTWLGVYRSVTPGVAVADNSTIFLDIDNDPQPDLCLYISPSHGGRVKEDEKGYIAGAPDLIVEIAASSYSFDLGLKQQVYRRNGVKEYIVHRTYDGAIDWFVLRDGQYDRVSPDADGIYQSEAFPGLWLAAPAMLAGKLADVLAILQRGTATAAHAEFVKMLIASKKV